MGIKQYKGKTGVSYQWKFQYNGNIHTGTFDTDSEREAKELFAIKKAEIRRGIKTESKLEKRTELLTDFIDKVYLVNRDTGNTGYVCGWIKEYFVGQRLDRISREDCEGFRASLTRRRVHKSKKRKPGTINREMSVLCSIFNLAYKQKRISVNPCTGLRLSAPRTLPVIWSREHARRAIEYCCDERAHLLPLLVVTLQTGLSRKDLFHLKVGQVQLGADQSVIRKERAKTGARIDIPLNAEAVEHLEPYLRGKQPGDYVFVNPYTGKPYQNCRQALDRVCELAGIPRISWHKLRHCVGTWLAEDGAGIEVIARFLAHSNFKTAHIYVQLAASALQSHADRLGAWVKTPVTPEKGPERQKSVKKDKGKLRLVG